MALICMISKTNICTIWCRLSQVTTGSESTGKEWQMELNQTMRNDKFWEAKPAKDIVNGRTLGML